MTDASTTASLSPRPVMADLLTRVPVRSAPTRSPRFSALLRGEQRAACRDIERFFSYWVCRGALSEGDPVLRAFVAASQADDDALRPALAVARDLLAPLQAECAQARLDSPLGELGLTLPLLASVSAALVEANLDSDLELLQLLSRTLAAHPQLGACVAFPPLASEALTGFVLPGQEWALYEAHVLSQAYNAGSRTAPACPPSMVTLDECSNALRARKQLFETLARVAPVPSEPLNEVVRRTLDQLTASGGLSVALPFGALGAEGLLGDRPVTLGQLAALTAMRSLEWLDWPALTAGLPAGDLSWAYAAELAPPALSASFLGRTQHAGLLEELQPLAARAARSLLAQASGALRYDLRADLLDRAAGRSDLERTLRLAQSVSGAELRDALQADYWQAAREGRSQPFWDEAAFAARPEVARGRRELARIVQGPTDGLLAGLTTLSFELEASHLGFEALGRSPESTLHGPAAAPVQLRGLASAGELMRLCSDLGICPSDSPEQLRALREAWASGAAFEGRSLVMEAGAQVSAGSVLIFRSGGGVQVLTQFSLDFTEIEPEEAARLTQALSERLDGQIPDVQTPDGEVPERPLRNSSAWTPLTPRGSALQA